MRDYPKFAGTVAGAAETLLSCGKEEQGSILSTARRNTEFLDTVNPHFKKTLESPDQTEDPSWTTFKPDVFKRAAQGASLFLCLPAERMSTHGRWLRLMIGLLLERAYRDSSPPVCGKPVLFLLEEFYTLGHMPMIEKAAGYAAGFGIKLWIVLQALQQLKALYPESWQTFLANAGAVQVFGVSDEDTTSYVSKALGEVEIIRHVNNHSKSYQSGQNASIMPPYYGIPSLPTSQNENHGTSQSTSQQIQIVPLLRSDEIARQFARHTGAALLLIKGWYPVWYMRVNYYASPWFLQRYVLDEKSREQLFPSLGRFAERSPEALRKVEEEFEQAADQFGIPRFPTMTRI
jgi:type IV secretion system protein VirD4